MNETAKSYKYRIQREYSTLFKGRGVDLGCGSSPLTNKISQEITYIHPYDWVWEGQDANTCSDLSDNTFDFVYSSHTLEHMTNPYEAFRNWIRICKPGGVIFTSVPHEIFYEKCVWPSKFADQLNLGFKHYTSWTNEWESNLPDSINVHKFINTFVNEGLVTKILAETALFNFDFTKFDEDQTLGEAICQIDFALRKL